MKAVHLLKVADAVVSAPQEFSGKKPYFATGDVDGTELGNASMVTYGDRPSRANLTAKPGDILFAKMQATSKVLHVTESSSDAVFSTGFCNLRPKIDLLASRYLFHFLNSPIFQHAKDTRCTGATQKALTLAALREIEIPLPENIDEQNRVVSILDKADAIRRKREQALTLADDFLRSVFLEMFGDPVRNPQNFSMLPFSKLVTTIDSGFSPKCEARPATSGEYGVLKVSAVSSTQFRADENKAVLPSFQPNPAHLVRKGDLLFSRKNTYELVGASALVELDTQNLALPDLIFRLVINPEIVTKEFLWAMLVQPSMREELRKIASGAAASMPNIGKGRLLDLEVMTPDFHLQQVFSEIYIKSRSMLANQRAQHMDATNLFAALSQRAFAGDL